MPDDALAPFLIGPFSTAEARRSGLSRRRLHCRRFQRPFRGVRSSSDPRTVLELCGAYLPKMAHECCSHITAAVIHAMWLPLDLERRLSWTSP